MDDQLLALLRQRYPVLASEMLGDLLEVVTTSRNLCGGDAEKFEILLLIAVRTTQHPEFGALDFDQVCSGQLPRYASLLTNGQSIAESTGIAKETVRRKVASLLSDGWVVRDGSGLSLAPRASRELADVRESVLHLAVRYFRLVARIAELELPASREASDTPAGTAALRGGQSCARPTQGAPCDARRHLFE